MSNRSDVTIPIRTKEEKRDCCSGRLRNLHERRKLEKEVERQREIMDEQQRTIQALTGGQPSTDVIVRMSRLEARNTRLIFAIQDAWTYVHGNCTINSVRERVRDALRDDCDAADAEVRRLRWIRDHLKITDIDYDEGDALLKLEPCCFCFQEGTEPAVDAGIDMLIDEERDRRRRGSHGPYEHIDKFVPGGGLKDADDHLAKVAKITQAERDRDTLAAAIREVAVNVGICRPDATLSGPQLLILLKDIESVLTETEK